MEKWYKQEAYFAPATRVWLAIVRAGSCQSNLRNSQGYEQLQKSKDSLKDCFENINIGTY